MDFIDGAIITGFGQWCIPETLIRVVRKGVEES